MSEEVLPLYPVVISLMFILRFDSITAVMILFLGTQAGYIGATINPFSVLLAQAKLFHRHRRADQSIDHPGSGQGHGEGNR